MVVISLKIYFNGRVVWGICGTEIISEQQTTPFFRGAACCRCQQGNGIVPFSHADPASLMQVGPSLLLPLLLCPFAIVCPSEFTLDSLTHRLFLSHTHTHTHTHTNPQTNTHTHTYYPFLGAVSDSGMKSISEPAPSHHPSPAPIFPHHEARPLLCQPEN